MADVAASVAAVQCTPLAKAAFLHVADDYIRIPPDLARLIPVEIIIDVTQVVLLPFPQGSQEIFVPAFHSFLAWLTATPAGRPCVASTPQGAACSPCSAEISLHRFNLVS
jgi:hypothetical protein